MPPLIFDYIRKTVQSTPGPFKKSNHSSLLISATVDAFRGHGFSLLVTAKTCAPAVTRRKDTGSWQVSFLRGLQLMHLPLRFRCKKHLLFPQKSPPALQSTNIDGNYDYRLVLSLAYLRIIYSCLRNKQLIDFLVGYYSLHGL